MLNFPFLPILLSVFNPSSYLFLLFSLFVFLRVVIVCVYIYFLSLHVFFLLFYFLYVFLPLPLFIILSFYLLNFFLYSSPVTFSAFYYFLLLNLYVSVSLLSLLLHLSHFLSLPSSSPSILPLLPFNFLNFLLHPPTPSLSIFYLPSSLLSPSSCSSRSLIF